MSGKKYLVLFFAVFKKKAIRIEKRFRFVISAGLLSAVVLISTFFSFDALIVFVPLLAILSYFMTYFSLLEGIDRVEWLMLFLVPVAVTIAFYLFYFLFPVRWLTRLPFMLIYSITIYAVLLCSNIFNVGVEKSLQLYRAAFSINFLYQTLISFLFFNIIFSFRLHFFPSSLLVGLIVFFLALQLLWSVKLNLELDRDTKVNSLLLSIAIGEITGVLSFVPLKPTILSLFLSASYYSLAGLTYNYLDQRLFRETIREYVTVWIVVLIITILSISW